MSLNVNIICTDKSSPDYQSAKNLKQIFEKSDPPINGDVLIMTNPILYGHGNRQELDLVVMCSLKFYNPGKIKFYPKK